MGGRRGRARPLVAAQSLPLPLRVPDPPLCGGHPLSQYFLLPPKEELEFVPHALKRRRWALALLRASGDEAGVSPSSCAPGGVKHLGAAATICWTPPILLRVMVLRPVALLLSVPGSTSLGPVCAKDRRDRSCPLPVQNFTAELPAPEHLPPGPARQREPEDPEVTTGPSFP